MAEYKLKIVAYPVIGAGNKSLAHTGFCLEKWENGVLVGIESIGLSGEWVESGLKIKFTEDNRNTPGLIDLFKIKNNLYDCFSGLSSDEAYRIYNQIKLEAKVINESPDRPTYLFIENNCNASTEYFIEKYLPQYNAQSIFSQISGLVLDGFRDFGGILSIEEVSRFLDNFYSVLRENNVEIDYSKIKIVSKNGGGSYLTITDNGKTYMFDDNRTGDLRGTSGEDVIYLGDGYNYVNAGTGNDVIYGGIDSDTIYGGSGNDIIHDKGLNKYTNFQGIKNYIYGGTGRDIIMSGKGNNRIYLGNDDDVDTVIVSNDKGFTDEVYNCTDKDNIIVRGSIKEIKVEGNDTIIYLYNGSKVIIHDYVEEEDEEDDNGNGEDGGDGGTGTGSGGSSSKKGGIYDDSGNKWVKGEDGEYVPTDPNEEDSGDNGGGDPGNGGYPRFEGGDIYLEGPDGEEIKIGEDNSVSKVEGGTQPPPRKGLRGWDIIQPGMCIIPKVKGGFIKGEDATSPLVIDLDGDGVVETIGVENGIYLDHSLRKSLTECQTFFCKSNIILMNETAEAV